MAFDFTVINYLILVLQHPPLQELILVILITISGEEDVYIFVFDIIQPYAKKVYLY